MTKIFTDGLDPSGADDVQILQILKKWNGGQFSDALFTFLAGALPQATVETVILRRRGEKIQVLLIPRPEGDPIWNGHVESPGSALRLADYKRPDREPVNGPFERIQEEEIKTRFTHPPILVGIDYALVERGAEAAAIYLAEIADEAKLPAAATWVNVEALEKVTNFNQHQRPRIKLAVEHFT